MQAKHATAPLKAGPPKTLAEAMKQRSLAEVTHCCPFSGCDFKALSKGNCRIHIFRVHYATESHSYFEDDACTLCDTQFNSSTHYYYHIGPCMRAHTNHTFNDIGVEKYL